MRTLLFVVSLATALAAMPAFAQLGPAGVPGAPGLVPPPPQKKTQPAPKVPSACAKAKNVERCTARHQEARAACKGRAGAEHKKCINAQLRAKES